MYGYGRRESKLKKFFTTLFLMILASISSIYLYKIYINIDVNKNVETTENNGSAVRLAVEEEEKLEISNTLEDVTKCVVGISKIKNNGESVLSVDATQNLSLGTGIVVSNNGYIITNWHLAGNKYSSCYVTLEDGNIYSGSVVWSDSDLDLAVVKINENNLKYLSLGDSDNISLGEKVYAIGNPIGVEFQRTITSGIISGLNRTIKIEEKNSSSYMEGLIQTDASINEGNSGGPLINELGEVIGINTIKIECAEGIGFAVPINIIKPVIQSFVSTGKFEEAYLGIFAYDQEVIKYLENDLEFDNGIYVVKIMQDGPVAKTTIKIGDVITKIDGNSINRMSELRNYIYQKKPGDNITLSIQRNNKEHDVQVILSKK